MTRLKQPAIALVSRGSTLIIAVLLIAIAASQTLNFTPAFVSYTNTYPWGTAACASSGPTLGATSGTGKWCDNYNWGESACPSGDGYCSASNELNGYYLLDQNGYGFRNCTSYVAWVVKQVLNKDVSGWKNANTWDSYALNAGYSNDSSPQVGDIADWTGGTYGHVAYVYAVSNGVATYAQYNYGQDGSYTDTYTSSSSQGSPNYYIHIGSITTSKTDIISTEPNGGVNAVQYVDGQNDGTGTNFKWQTTNITNNTAPGQMAMGDVDGDGKADIIATEPSDQPNCANGVKYMVGIAKGDGTFTWTPTTLTCDTPPGKMTVGDLDHNGKADIIATEPSGQANCANGVKYMVGLDSGTMNSSGQYVFTYVPTTMTCNTAPTQLASADMNGDGKADVIGTEPNCPNGVKYMDGITNNSATINSNPFPISWDATSLTCDTTPTQMALGKVYGNGLEEIVATQPSCTNGVEYWTGLNDGGGINFSWQPSTITCNQPPSHMAVGDMTNDSIDDIVATEPSAVPNCSGVKYMDGISNKGSAFTWTATSLTCDTAPNQMGLGIVRNPS